MNDYGNYTSLNLQHWFPTTIGVVDCPFHKDIKKDYQNYLNDFEFNDMGLSYTHIHKNEKFKILNEWITKQVNQYTKLHNYPDMYEANESWVIDYKLNQNQPWHTHTGCTISTVYYFDSNVNDSSTKFRSPYHNDTSNPLNLNPSSARDVNNFNELTFPSCSYTPVEGRLLIFRSYIEHSVDNKQIKSKRVIFSYNFDKKVKL